MEVHQIGLCKMQQRMAACVGLIQEIKACRTPGRMRTMRHLVAGRDGVKAMPQRQRFFDKLGARHLPLDTIEAAIDLVRIVSAADRECGD
jgi:hypothetical protein